MKFGMAESVLSVKIRPLVVGERPGRLVGVNYGVGMIAFT